ncbi:MAG: permease [Chloroflexi bacterium]|nr:permease [Chloroflexota bacterium]MDA8187062.1 permease [Dehalococcoidales bacterium]
MSKVEEQPASAPWLWVKLVIAAALWVAAYQYLEPLSGAVSYSLLGLDPASHLGSAVGFFLYDVPKILLLLSLIVFLVGIVRSFFTPERARKALGGRREGIGNVLAATLGIVTPFCSCSAVPLFLGFVESGVPLGVTFSFLISAPMVNEVALALLFGMFGWRVAALYVATGLGVAISAGWIIGRLHLERWVADWVYQVRMGEVQLLEGHQSWTDRIDYAVQAVRDIVGKVWPYVIAGIAVGAAIHGYVPEDFMAGIMGKSAWWSVPAAVLVGIPMYSNAAGIIPVVQALMEKGASLGTVLAFMMSVIALSLPEVIILRRVLKWQLIAVFLGVVGTGIIAVGYLFNAVL